MHPDGYVIIMSLFEPHQLRMIESARNYCCCLGTDDEIAQILEKPEFQGHYMSRPGNWRIEIPCDIESEWDNLSSEARLVAFLFASEAAHERDWD